MNHLGPATAFYLAAALADAHWTLKGLGGDIGLEGNPILRGMMGRFGIAEGLFIEKMIVGVSCFLIAWLCAPEIRRNAPWIEKIPSTRWARDWMKRGERSWIAYVPLYGTALFQCLAAGSWILVLRR